MMPNKKRPKISTTEFRILKYSEYTKLYESTYNTCQLKALLKHYRQKQSGNKNELFDRIYNFLRNSYNAVKIQKLWRGHRLRELHGPAFIKRGICINTSDLLTLEDMPQISPHFFFSFIDQDNFVYGFDINSLHEYICDERKKGHSEISNPYNRRIIPEHIISTAHSLYKRLNISKPVDKHQTLHSRVVRVFQKLDEMGYYTNTNWFYNMSVTSIRMYVHELKDIWMYRAGLSQQMRLELYTGNPFEPYLNMLIRHQTMNDNEDYDEMLFHFREGCISVLENFLFKTSNMIWVISSYIIAAFTLVDINAALAVPWLYSAVVEN